VAIFGSTLFVIVIILPEVLMRDLKESLLLLRLLLHGAACLED
jgi:hypothetical protein